MRETLAAAALTGYEPMVGAALWQLEDARSRTLRLLREMPAEYVDRETGGNSIGTVLYHVALIEADWLYTEILERPLAAEVEALLPVDHRDDAGILSLVRGQTLDQLLERLSAIRRTFLDELRGMTDEDFHRLRALPDYDVSPAWVLHHLAQHEAEHRAEIGAAIARLRDYSPVS
jgi:uncharacterized damage-inducible protein DinB